MKLFKNLFGNKEETVTESTVQKPVEKKEPKRTMPEVNQKELYRQEKQKRREAAALKREEEAKIKEEERQVRLAEIREREAVAKAEQAAKRVEKTEQAPEVNSEKIPVEEKTEDKKVELFGYEFELLEKGQQINVEIMDEDNSNFFVRSTTNYQEAILPKIELDSEVKVGDEIKVLVFKYYAEEFYVSERRLNNKERSAKLDQSYQQNDQIEAKLVKYDEPFFIAELADGVSAKVYQANIDTKFVNADNAEEYLNQTYLFNVKKKIRKSHTIELELERKSIVEAEVAEKFNAIQIGDRFTVDTFTANKGGLEFDYNGFRGFIPLSEVSYFFFKNSNDALAHIDSSKEVEVIELKDKRNKTVVCSIKICEKSPWEIIRDSYGSGDTITRDVIDKKDFGLIFEIEKNVNGLLHTSEMSDELVNEMENVTIGDTVTFMIKEIDTINQRIALTNIKE